MATSRCRATIVISFHPVSSSDHLIMDNSQPVALADLYLILILKKLLAIPIPCMAEETSRDLKTSNSMATWTTIRWIRMVASSPQCTMETCYKNYEWTQRSNQYRKKTPAAFNSETFKAKVGPWYHLKKLLRAALHHRMLTSPCHCRVKAEETFRKRHKWEMSWK